MNSQTEIDTKYSRCEKADELPNDGPDIAEKNGVLLDAMGKEKYGGSDMEKMIPRTDRTLEDVYRDLELTEETTCGIWVFRGRWLQQFANKKAYVFLYGLLGCMFSASYAYFNGTLTIMEKRFKIPSKTTGIISVGNDMSAMLVSAVLSYYAGRGNRPRWTALGTALIGVFCVMTALPQLLYGSGESALALTTEYGGTYEQNATGEVFELVRQRTLCHEKDVTGCEINGGNFAPKLIFFVAQFISGIGGSLYHTMGVSYMDDNIKRSKTPALLSLTYFIRLLGPALGYALAAFCVKIYISPSLTPTIDNTDPRWLGAWWLGWLVVAIPLFVFALLMAMFPKTLPRAAARKVHAKERLQLLNKENPENQVSIKDMFKTFKRLLCNTTYMLNNLASVFYFMGYMPYWIFMPKYIEMQYRQSASVSSMVTGTLGLFFSAIGILLSGFVISKFKPRARYLAAWNVFVGAISVVGILSYIFLGCSANDNLVSLGPNGELETALPCNENCNCDFVKYSPVCSDEGKTFISACHAGCKQQQIFPNGSKIFTECGCVRTTPTSIYAEQWVSGNTTTGAVSALASGWGNATPGSCPADCQSVFYMFLVVVCIVKSTGASGRASNFLVSVRCVDEKDKPAGIGLGIMIMSLFSFIPSPILFGAILDSTCLVWGQTCEGTGNCWLYNGESLRYLMNLTAASFVTVGTLFDMGVWYYVKDLRIFDEEDEETNITDVKVMKSPKETEMQLKKIPSDENINK